MNKDNLLNDQLSRFFFDNGVQMDEMIELYEHHKKKVLDIQKARITDLLEEITKITKVKWWAWQGWDLGYSEFNKSKPRIGIESSFHVEDNNPLGEFRIYITTWKLKDWTPYEQILEEKYPSFRIDKEAEGRVYMHMPPIEGDNEELILEKLKEYYDFLVEITK